MKASQYPARPMSIDDYLREREELFKPLAQRVAEERERMFPASMFEQVERERRLERDPTAAALAASEYLLPR